jgi:hypothetical protein
MRRSIALVEALALCLVAACSSTSSNDTGDAGGGAGSDAGAGADAGAGLGADGGSGVASDGGLSLAGRTAAVNQTIAKNSSCAPLNAFYWEIGDVTGALASGKVGATFDGTTKMNIASASKFVFGAYVVERFQSDLTMLDASAMRMMSGYVSLDYDTCLTAKSVSACFMAAQNSTLTSADVGRFDYNGGHFQRYAAVDLGLGDDDAATLATDIKSQVGTEFAFTYSSPQLAAGINTSATDYAAFLRKILAGKLAIGAHLGENAVCTQPSTCPTAVYSPAPAAWHYSYGHWVEDDPPTGDGAFSSPGAFGFYPWIDATKTYYGIVARYSLATGAYVQSAECGIEIRKAFMTGVAQ